MRIPYLKGLALSVVTVGLSGCGTVPVDRERPKNSGSPVESPRPQSSGEEARRLDALLEQYFEDYLKMNPVQATFIQDGRYNYLIPNFLSPTMKVANRAFDHHWLHRIEREIDRDALTGQARLSYDIFVSQRKNSIEGYAFPDDLQPITQFFSIPSIVAQFGSGQSIQPFQTVKDYEDWLLRMTSVAVLFDQAIINMREGIQKGVVQPRVLVEKSIPQVAAHVTDDVERSVFWMPVKNIPDTFSPEDTARLREAYRGRISQTIVPAYRRLHDFLKNTYLPKARKTHGLWALPNGEAWYAYKVKTMTTTDKHPREIHALGLREVERIHREMRGVMNEVGFTGDLPAFFKHVREDDRYYYSDADAVLQGYRDLQSKVNKLLPRLFDVFPKADYEVREVEAFRAKTSAAASYQSPSPDGSRPGIFYVNTYDLKRQPKFGMETLSLHEASPGHHFQLSIQQEVDTLPKFRRFGGYTAYAEGWGLYAESIGKELGMFTDPMQYYGKLDAELLRAMRLVVDTGLHHERWTREQAIEFMRKNSSMSDADIIPEVERYIAIPGQALAYKIGELALWDLRKKAEHALAARFDVKAFHREILVDGALPLDVLSTKVDEWIARTRDGQTARAR